MNRTRTVAGVVLGLGTVFSVGGCVPNQTTPGGDTAGKALVANLRGTDGAQADVEFVEKDGHTEFVLAITGGQPGASVEVAINGLVVLSIQLDDFGNARVEFDSEPDELGEEALPPSFPAADGGDSIGVGDLTGNFENNDNENDNAGDKGDDDDEGGDDDANDNDSDDGNVNDDSGDDDNSNDNVEDSTNANGNVGDNSNANDNMDDARDDNGNGP